MIVKLFSSIILLTTLSITSFSQSVGIGTTNPDSNAALDVQSGSTPQGMYIPRLQASDRIGMSLTTVNTGLLVYDLDSLDILQWNGTQWKSLGSNGASGSITKVTTTKAASYPPSAFISYDTDTYITKKDNLAGDLGTIVYFKHGTGNAYGGCGVHLPEEAVVTAVTSYFYDVNRASGYDLEVTLMRKTHGASVAEPITNIYSSLGTAVDGSVSGTIDSAKNVINNKDYLYYFHVNGWGPYGGNETLGLYGVVINYTIQEIP